MNKAKGQKIDQCLLELGMEAARDSERMCRISFTLSTMVSLAIILAMWNTYWSWYNGFIVAEKLSESEVTGTVQKEMLEQWVENTAISFPFLGIKVGVSDGAIFGSSILFFITLWLYLCIRRQRHVIANFFSKTSNWEPKAREWVYFGVTSYILFIDLSEIDEEIKKGMKLMPEHYNKSFMQKAFQWWVLLPPMTILLLIISDILTVFVLPASFRFPYNIFFDILQPIDKLKYLAILLYAVISMFSITYLCYRIWIHTIDTGGILYRYAESFQKEPRKTSRA